MGGGRGWQESNLQPINKIQLCNKLEQESDLFILNYFIESPYGPLQLLFQWLQPQITLNHSKMVGSWL